LCAYAHRASSERVGKVHHPQRMTEDAALINGNGRACSRSADHEIIG
jgi:hypothetical protein